MFFVVFALILFVSSGCSSLQTFLFPEQLDRDAKIAWKHDLKMQVNGIVYYGTALLPHAETYDIKIWPPYKEIDRLLWNTCHRGDHADKAVKNYFWPWKKDDEFFQLKFSPMPDEQNRTCSLRFSAFEQKHRNIAFGRLSFQDTRPEVILPATTVCSGKTEHRFGKNVCEAPVNLFQKIYFNQPVLATTQNDDGNCEPPKNMKDNLEWAVYPSKDECVYVFMSNERSPENQKRLMFIWEVYGWEEIPPPDK